MYSKKEPPEEPPCSTCRPALLPENKDCVDVYLITRGQYVTAGMGEIVDIHIPSVKIVMDLLGVKNQADCLVKVRNLFYQFRPQEKGK